tara:strand:- start:3755 stop:5935 length:2181 start_codon:yes stop_codon:yes gene_type:complete
MPFIRSTGQGSADKTGMSGGLGPDDFGGYDGAVFKTTFKGGFRGLEGGQVFGPAGFDPAAAVGTIGYDPIANLDAAVSNAAFGMPTIDLDIKGVQDDLNTYAANNPMSQIAQNIAAAGLDPSGRADPQGPAFDTTFDRNLPGGGAVDTGTNTIDMSTQGTGADALDPNVIIDDAARDGTTIEDLIGTYKDPDGNPYSIASVIGALILSGNKNAATVLSNSGYNPDGTPMGGAGNVPAGGAGNDTVAAGGGDDTVGGGGGDADAGVDAGADPGDLGVNNQPDGNPPGGNPPGGNPPRGNPPGGNQPDNDTLDVDDTNDDTGGGLSIPDIIEGGATTAAALGGAMASGFGSGFSNTERTTSRMDPDIKNRLTDLYGPTPGVMNSLVNRLNTGYGGFTGDRYGDMNEDQLRFNEMVRNNIENIPGKSIFDKAVTRADSTATPTGMDVAKTAFGPTDQPLATAARENIKDVVAGQFAGTNLDPYQNPYNNAVIDTALADLDRATQMRLRTADDQATKAGAYGGDRAAIERGLIGEESLRTAGRMVADLRARGFEDAANRVEADLDRNLKAQEANQLADRQTSRDALDTATAIERDDPLNQLRTAEALINAFSTGSDQYRNNLGDFMSVGDRLDARDQRERDFQFAEFLASIGYDQDMINNMINLLSTATGDRQEETKTEMGTVGQLAQIAEIAPALGGMIGGATDFIGGLFNRGDNDRDKGAYPNARYKN